MISTEVVVDDSARLVSSKIAAATGSGPVRHDPTGSFARQQLMQGHGNRIEMGLVTRSGCGGYDCSVKIGHDSVACMVVSKNTAQVFGVSAGSVPVAGSYVLVLLIGGSKKIGYIIGTIPLSWRLKPNTLANLWTSSSYPNEKFDPYWDVGKNNLPYKGGPRHSDQIWSGTNRPRDIHPGESTDVNENRVGVTENMYGVELCGGASYVRVSRMDDEIRMRSTNFQKWTNQEFDWEFNDGGHISSEGRYYSYQGEFLGGEGHAGPEYHKPEDTIGREPRPRIRFWKSFLGNLLSFFVVRARKSKGDFDTTLASLHVSQAGNVMVKAGGGVSIERYERIPTPKRLKKPWDPQGDREKDCPHEPFKPFKVEVPHDRGLAEASKQAWEVKTHYQRWDELKKDFKVQNENEVKLPQDDDEDPKHSKEIKYSDYRDRHAGIFVGDDGSIIIRDTWGSEIVMLGGNILINSPGNVITTTNRDIVSIAKQSVVMRGTEAAEMSSEEGDTRVHAKKLLTMAGGTDESDGGVLIESLASGPAVAAPAKAGSAAFIGGVVVRSEKAGVLLSGKNAYVNGKDNVFIWGGEDGGTRPGNVFMSGKNAIITGAKFVGAVVQESCMMVSEKFAGLLSPKSALVYGGSGAMIVNEDQVPILWSGSVEQPDLSSIKKVWTILQDSNIRKPYDWDNVVENALYSFRTDMQAKTDKGIEPWRPNGQFTLYEPWWQVMKDYGDPNIEKADPYHPEAKSVHGSKCWPCMSAIESGVFKKCPKPVNLDNWWSKPREGLSDSETIVNESMGNFTV